MILNQANSKKQGDVGTGIAIGWFVAKGYTVSVPLTDSQGYDLVVEIKGVLKKVQVKTSTFRRTAGSYVVELRTKGGNRSGSGKVKLFSQCKVDLLFVLTADGKRYLIPAKDCPAGSISLGEKWDSYVIRE